MKKKIILIMLIIIIFTLDIYLFYNYIFLKYKNKHMLENTDIKLATQISNSPFKINKIILYSSASAENKNTNFQNPNWILDIFQYTDIAIYLDSNSPIKSLFISEPQLNNSSEKLYYLDGTKFGTDYINKNFEILDTLEFSVLNFDNKDNSIKYNTPVFFADSSNPITLKFTNTLLTNYSIKNTEKIQFNGSLLTKTPITLNQLNSKISFNVNVIDYNNNNYSTLLNIDIPIQDTSSTIFDGHICIEQNLNTPLFQIQK